MKMQLYKKFRFAISIILSAALGLSSLTAHAAVENTVMTAAAAKLIDNNSVLKEYSFNTEEEAVAHKLVDRFIENNKTYYEENALKNDFPHFEVLKYLAENRTVFTECYKKLKDEGKKYNVEDMSQYALDYYLEKGAYEWQRSCDYFDPIMAIVSDPIAFAGKLKGDETPDMIRELYYSMTGKSVTCDLSVHKLEEGGYVLVDKVLSDMAVQQNAQSTANASSGGSSDEGKDDDPQEDKKFINHNARAKIAAYALYQDANAPGTHAVYNTAASGQPFNGNFYADTYQSIKETAGNKQKYTVMVYMCGTDLEHDGGALASTDIMYMLRSEYGIEDANVLILAGGTSDWTPQTMKVSQNDNVNCCLYYLDSSQLTEDAKNAMAQKVEKKDLDTVITSDTLKLLANFNEVSMGDSELLLGFLDTAYELFPAEHYWLSLWNHGGGSASGICFSDSKEGLSTKQLTIAGIEEALSNSKIYNKTEDGFSIISADACLMGGLEIAYNLSPYAKYYIGSEDLTTGNVPYDLYFKYFKDGMNESEFAIAVNASEAYMNRHQLDLTTVSTNTVFDLSKLKNCADSMNAFGNAMSSLLKNQASRDAVYQAIRDAAAASYYFGGSLTMENTDYADMVYYLNRLTSNLELAKEKNQDASVASLYNTALQEINNVRSIELLAYSAAYFKNSYVYELKNQEGNPGGLASAAAYENNDFLNLHGYSLYGASLFVPFRKLGYLAYDFAKAEDGAYNAQYVKKDDEVERYLSEAIFSGYADFLKEYISIANSESEFNRIKNLDAALKDSGYKDAISDMQVVQYEYTNGDGDKCKDYVIRLNFAAVEIGGERSTTAFMETIKGVAVQAMRSDTMVIKNEEGEENTIPVDIVISTSNSIPTSIFISENASVGTRDEKANWDSLVIDTNMIEMIAYYLTGYVNRDENGDGNTEKVNVFDWGTQGDTEYYNSEEKSDVYTTDNSVLLDGIVYKEEEGELKEYRANLLFALSDDDEDEDSKYLYAGYVYKGDDGNYIEVEKSEYTHLVALSHYMIKDNEGKTELIRVEDEGKLELAPIFDVEYTLNLSKKEISSTVTNDAVNGSEHNRYALEIEAADGTKTEFMDPDGSYAKVDEYTTNDKIGTCVDANTTDDGEEYEDEDEQYKNAPGSQSEVVKPEEDSLTTTEAAATETVEEPSSETEVTEEANTSEAETSEAQEETAATEAA